MIKFEVNNQSKVASAIYFMNLAITKVAYATITIWEIISSCFGTGTWRKANNWSSTDIWKNY